MQKIGNLFKAHGVYLTAIYLLLDIAALLLAFGLSVYIRKLLIPVMGGRINLNILTNWLELTLGISILINFIIGLYTLHLQSNVTLFKAIVYAVSISFGTSIFVVYLLGYANVISRMILFLNWVIGLFLVLVFRIGLGRVIMKLDWVSIPTVIVGRNLQEIIESRIIPKLKRYGFSPEVLYTFSTPAEDAYKRKQVIQISEQALSEIDPNRYRAAIYLNYYEKPTTKKNDIKLLSQFFKEIFIIMPNLGFGNVWLQSYDMNGELALRLKNQLLYNRYRFIKRVIDIILSLILVIPALLLIMVVGLLIKLESRGPIIIVQKRLGRGGHIFKLYKFRTMYENADEKLQHILSGDVELQKEFIKFRKLKNDPRVTVVGRLLRKYSLDEVPQLINVLKGEMSLVGPRPYLPEELEGEDDFLNYYSQILPGMTGWWQVMARNQTSFRNRIKLDIYYITNWSLWMDLYVIIKTVFEVISGKGY